MNVFISHSFRDQEFVAMLAGFLRDEGHFVYEPTSGAAEGRVSSEISAAIRSTDMLIAVVTGSNPSIFFELGMAAGVSVPIIITASTGEAIPSDLASVPFVQRSGDSLRDAQSIVRQLHELKPLPLP